MVQWKSLPSNCFFNNFVLHCRVKQVAEIPLDSSSTAGDRFPNLRDMLDNKLLVV
uniref:Uncharacterized protein n=1 Tax=Medicago truncatula TaxID=3880 RepID=A2Q1F2_MEDTR|nr:hypothetical protein MtrDRAFT_AC148815g35v2 [Medicago truncatula]